MGTILGFLIALAGLAGGLALKSQGQFDLGMLVFIAGALLGFGVAWITQYLALGKAVWDWVALMRRNPDSVDVVSVHPPKGFIFRRDAVVTVDVTDEGQTTRKDQGFPIPWLPAFLWRVAGKVPTPIGRLTDKRDLNAKVWGRGSKD
jgi:hypothetical protein